MRGARTAAAALWALTGCAATEGPLLRRLDQDSGAPSALDPADGASGTGSSTAAIVPGMSFQYQLVGSVDADVDAELFVIDLFNAPEETIDALHQEGKVVAAYLSAGTRESFRDDAESFPESAVGQPLASYPNESWLDVRDPTVRELMAVRLDLARDKGFDALVRPACGRTNRTAGSR